MGFVRPRERGRGLAWRVSLFTEDAKVERIDGAGLFHFTATSPLGRHRVSVEPVEGEAAMFVLNAAFTPASKLHLPYLPRDLVAVGPDARPDKPKGQIEAKQRRLNTGLCYFDLLEPSLGKVLYVQDLTALNEYFLATGTKPENAVGGEWPEVGYLAPTRPQDPSTAPPGGKEITLSRAFLLVRSVPQKEEAESAWRFLDMLASVYRRLDRPLTVHRDWVERSRRTLDDLRSSPKARTRHGGHVYFHPYTASENPDSMVPLSLLSAIHDWGQWNGKRDPLEREIRNGLEGFHDEQLETIRRYLPDVSPYRSRSTGRPTWPRVSRLRRTAAPAGHRRSPCAARMASRYPDRKRRPVC